MAKEFTEETANNATTEETREFSKVFRGYDIAEVDEYINKLTENYSALYRENAELEHKYAEASERLAELEDKEEQIQKTLSTARAAANKIVSDAYERSDAILASIKKSCDKILRNFRDKIEMNQKVLSEMHESIYNFKNELFERYRLHIELIEQLTPMIEAAEEKAPQEIVENVISSVGDEIKAEYGISLMTFDLGEPEEKPTESAPATEEPTVRQSEEKDESPKKENEADKKPKRKRKANAKDGVMKLLDEYEAPLTSASGIPAVQMSFDFDGTPGNLSDTEDEK